MNTSMMREISEGLQKIVSSTPDGSNTRNALYDLTLMHTSAVEAQVAFKNLMKDPSDFYLIMDYSGANNSFILIPYWMSEFAEDHEVSKKNRERIKKIKQIASSISKIGAPIFENNKKDYDLAEKIISLWKYIETELLDIWIETVQMWDIKIQMSCFTKDTCQEYIKNIIGYQYRPSMVSGKDCQIQFVLHFKELYYEHCVLQAA